jgi:hypothetical protein
MASIIDNEKFAKMRKVSINNHLTANARSRE